MSWTTRVIAEYVAIGLLLFLATQTDNIIAWWLIALLIGNRMHALGIIGHWAMHGILPKWMMWAGFIPNAIDPAVYRRSHAAHHAYLGELSDPEVRIVSHYWKRWVAARWIDTVLDMIGLHTDEAIDIMRTLASPKSWALWLAIVGLLAVPMGLSVIVLPMAFAGALATHRWRARHEHDHINMPGVTFKHVKPPLWKRLIVLPHFAWLHAEHHDYPAKAVWQ